MSTISNLFGDEFEIKLKTTSVKDLMSKTLSKELKDKDLEKALKSKAVSLEERLIIIRENVLRILSKQKDNILVIKDLDSFKEYISKAFSIGAISIDTETNNSLDPVTCKIAGLCLYVPGEKQAYIPINHRDPHTKERFAWQITEEQCKEQLDRLTSFKKIWKPDTEEQSYFDWFNQHTEIENKDKAPIVIMHNGKFDYEVLKCTCGVEVVPDWDTIVCARLLNENERAGLKEQYTAKIDPEQEKYDISSLFENVSYLDVEPEIFAYYAAHDSGMTYELFELQRQELYKEEYGPHIDISGKHQVKGLRWLFHNVEMPIVVVTAEMELTGVAVDENFGEKLKEKYYGQLKTVDEKIASLLDSVSHLVHAWTLTKEANEKTVVYVPKKTKMSLEKIEKTYPEVDKSGNRFKYGKAKVEQLSDPVNLSSTVQLAILLFDILKAPQKTADSRATGEDELKEIVQLTEDIFIKKIKQKNKFNVPPNTQAIIDLCSLVLERRGLLKAISTYIEVIPALAKHWPDGRVRFHLNALGTDTGRYSSGGEIKLMENEQQIVLSGINIQNIPATRPEMRLMFVGDTKKQTIDIEEDNLINILEYAEVETARGWKYPKDLTTKDLIITNDKTELAIKDIEKKDKNYIIYFD